MHTSIICGMRATVAASILVGVVAAASEETTLRQAARSRFLIGAAVGSRGIAKAETAGLLSREFDSLTAENEFKPQSVQPSRGMFRFAEADKIAAFAEARGMKLVGHTLCWHSQSPSWMFRGDDGKPLPREEALRNLEAHIKAVAGHFRGKVVGWDVVNEAISDRPDEYLRDTPALRAIGEDYILKAFEFARAADPEAELYYNDYGNESPKKLEKTIRLIRSLKAGGAKVDAVGIQGHFRLDAADTPERLDRAIAAYAKEGVKVVISELDVDVLPRGTTGANVGDRERSGADPYTKGLPAEVAAKQAKYYARIFEVVLRHPGVVTRVTFWGTHDGASWLNMWPVFRRTNHPLLWDRSFEPKPAYRSVIEVLNRR
ncbi:MAG: endo-1,4-beta-xylanase [Isosphaeraceae bacterium]|nr:endo-1,4-beta-xylanase [Isosphaeraceae bacterium]